MLQLAREICPHRVAYPFTMEPESEPVTSDPVTREPEDKEFISPATTRRVHAETCCEICDIGLNGPTHWEDHKRRKTHRGNNTRTFWVELRNVISGQELTCQANSIWLVRKFVERYVLAERYICTAPSSRPHIRLMLGTKVLHDDLCLIDLADTVEELENLVIDYIVLQPAQTPEPNPGLWEI